MRTTAFITILGLTASILTLQSIREANFSTGRQKSGDKTFLIDTGMAELPEGYDYMSHFVFENSSQATSLTRDNSGTMMFADKKGILLFDGSNEIFIKIEDAPRKIVKLNGEDMFFIACAKGFGVLSRNSGGAYEYRTLSSKYKDTEGYFDVLIINDKVIFSGERKLVQVDVHDVEKTEVLFEDQKRLINHVFFYNNKLYLNFYKTGLHVLENKKALKSSDEPLFSENQIVFTVPLKNKLILGLSNNALYRFDGKNLKAFQTTSDAYINESVITGAIDFLNNRIALLTLNGGVVLLDNNTGETLQTINYRTGLPDDEIFAAFVDPEGGLWLSHAYGISRIGFNIPVKSYGNYPGLAGKISSSIVNNNILYVGTGEGLFYLSEIKSYEEVKVATDRWVKTTVVDKHESDNNSEAVIETNVNEVNVTEDNTNEETGILSKWKKRKEEKKKEKEQKEELIEKLNQGIYTDEEISKNTNEGTGDETIETEENITELKKVTEYRKIYELQSVKYTFKKIEGINGKCRKLVGLGDAVLAITNTGLFEVDHEGVTPIISGEYIYNISGLDKNNTFYATTAKGIYRINMDAETALVVKLENNKFENVIIKNILVVNDSTFWATSLNNIYLINAGENRIVSFEQFKIDNDINDEIRIVKNNNLVRFFAGNQSYVYNEELNNVTPDNELNEKIANALLLFPDENNVLVIDKDVHFLGDTQKKIKNVKYLNLIDNIDGTFMIGDDVWAFTRDNMIFRVTNQEVRQQPFTIFINSVLDNDGNRLDKNKTIKIKSDYKKLRISLSSPYYTKSDFVRYFYSTNTKDESGFIETPGSEVIIPQLAPGEHVIYFYAINGLNDKSEIIELKLDIKPPFWKSLKFIIALFLAFIVLLFWFLTSYYKRKQRKIREYNEILELKVKERTAEISKQNDLIKKQNDEIKSQNEMIVFQNEEITGSIRYAEKIQKAVLADIEIQPKYVSAFFNLFKPRDIVSGDFYWVYEAQNKLIVAAADCTGHGVPGGFLSMLGISFLNEIVNESVRSNVNLKAAEILNALREKIITTISRHQQDTAQDGMDISIVVIDREKMILNFAGANNPTYIARDGLLTKIDADRMPVGYNKKLNGISFTNRLVKLKEKDTVYLFTDGFADQFGGEHNKKFNVRRFKEMLTHLQKYPMEKQKYMAEMILQKWQKDHMQIDDILLIGIQI